MLLLENKQKNKIILKKKKGKKSISLDFFYLRFLLKLLKKINTLTILRVSKIYST